MREHNANELITKAQILDNDAVTVLSACLCGVQDLSGRRLEQAQYTSPQTTHMILMRACDSIALKESGYVLCEGVLYVVDYQQDPRKPRPRMWREIYCHVERMN